MIRHKKPSADKVAGLHIPSETESTYLSLIPERNFDAEYQYFENVIDPNSVKELLQYFNSIKTSEDVSIHGVKDLSVGIGSKRSTVWSTELAEAFTKQFRSLFGFDRITNDYTRTDCWQNIPEEYSTDDLRWEFIGFSPMFRFMSYLNGGEHYAHYDSSYIYDDPQYRTLSSVVIYLTTNKSGATRFIYDNQDSKIQSERKTNDWKEKTRPELVYKEFYPVSGSMLTFDHRICHDVSQFIPQKENEKRIIIRTDLIYKLV